MIFTVGHRASYDAALAEMAAQGKPLLKVGRGLHRGVPYEGGSVWPTRAAAQAYLDAASSDPDRVYLKEYAVYGVVADWKEDTLKAPGNVPWRCLKQDAAVVALEESDAV